MTQTNTSMNVRFISIKALLFIGAFFVLLFWGIYLVGYASAGNYPIDFITFMEIGDRWLQGQEIYIENSYYPLPMVAVFAAFASLPESVAYILWVGWRVLASLAISRNFWILAFSPQVNVQSSGFGMLGLWGYRRWPERFLGGAFLALTTLKPQLAIFPVAWAVWEWWKRLRGGQGVSRSVYGFSLITSLFYGLSFLVYPAWLFDWLGNLRQIRGRAIAGLAPRIFYYFNLPLVIYWIVLIALFALAVFWLWRKKKLNLDIWVTTSFIFSPLIHNYDLIQLTPIMENRRLARAAILASLPGWITILFFYANDHAWATMTLVAPVLLFFLLRPQVGRSNSHLKE